MTLETLYNNIIKDLDEYRLKYPEKNYQSADFAPTFKTRHSNNITLEDWNTLQQYVSNLNSDSSVQDEYLNKLATSLMNFKEVLEQHYYSKEDTYSRAEVYTKDEAIALGLINITSYNEDTGEISILYNADLYDVTYDETTGNLIFAFKDNSSITEKKFKLLDPEFKSLVHKDGDEEIGGVKTFKKHIYVGSEEGATPYLISKRPGKVGLRAYAEDGSTVFGQIAISNTEDPILGKGFVNIFYTDEDGVYRGLRVGKLIGPAYFEGSVHHKLATEDFVRDLIDSVNAGDLDLTNYAQYTDGHLTTASPMSDDHAANKSYVDQKTVDMVEWYGGKPDNTVISVPTIYKSKIQASPYNISNISLDEDSNIPTASVIKKYVINKINGASGVSKFAWKVMSTDTREGVTLEFNKEYKLDLPYQTESSITILTLTIPIEYTVNSKVSSAVYPNIYKSANISIPLEYDLYTQQCVFKIYDTFIDTEFDSSSAGANRIVFTYEMNGIRKSVTFQDKVDGIGGWTTHLNYPDGYGKPVLKQAFVGGGLLEHILYVSNEISLSLAFKENQDVTTLVPAGSATGITHTTITETGLYEFISNAYYGIAVLAYLDVHETHKNGDVGNSYKEILIPAVVPSSGSIEITGYCLVTIKPISDGLEGNGILRVENLSSHIVHFRRIL